MCGELSLFVFRSLAFPCMVNFPYLCAVVSRICKTNTVATSSFLSYIGLVTSEALTAYYQPLLHVAVVIAVLRFLYCIISRHYETIIPLPNISGSVLQEKFSLETLNYLAKDALDNCPEDSDWQEKLSSVLRQYYRSDDRDPVRLRALHWMTVTMQTVR